MFGLLNIKHYTLPPPLTKNTTNKAIGLAILKGNLGEKFFGQMGNIRTYVHKYTHNREISVPSMPCRSQSVFALLSPHQPADRHTHVSISWNE